MNLLLLTPQDRREDGHWQIADRRAHHVRTVLGLTPGATLRAGLLDDGLGHAHLVSDDGRNMVLAFNASMPPPPPLPLTLILALPRPKMLRRILIDASSLGVKRIVLLNSYKVDKSYWRTPELGMPLLEEKLRLGLEQAGDTVMPSLWLRDRFKPFIEDELPTLCEGSQKLLAHPAPGQTQTPPGDCTVATTLAIGPEGGWTPYEASRFLDAEFTPCTLGQRILRVETAVPALIARIMRLP
ncbi:16S rRNA (uracil(1498)-N(3))-methyltransferase [Isoalcanivorax indicus]|uniref:16S rRNA (uracil(1498)-N(3))-methyltransferase n=1 Tax=Isoalcanivorax indicus TaxID=2202653 RepID=UPI000DBA224D|nr:16S rRNA (uracil(1498)-N(3))-methyltransferase [Isoalcanivorax indicus]